MAALAAAVVVAVGLVAGLLVVRTPGGAGPAESAADLVVDEATSSLAATEAATAGGPGVASVDPAADDRVEAAPAPPGSAAARPVAVPREPAGDSAAMRAPIVAEPSRSAPPPPPPGDVADRRDRPAPRAEGETVVPLTPAAGADREETAVPAGPAGRRIGRPRSIGAAEAIDESVASGMRLVLQVQPPDAYVLVDGTVVGQVREFSPQARRTLDLPSVGEHTVVFRRAGMRDRTVRVDARSDGPAITPLVGRLLPLAAAETPLHELESHRVGRAIAFQVRPADAKVLVDGRPVGVASQFPGGRLRRGEWLELTPGVHRVSLVAPGHRQVDLAIDVTSGALEERKRIEVVLLPLPPGGAP